MKSAANHSATLPLGIGAMINTIPNALDVIKLQKFWEGINRKGPQAAEQLLNQVVRTHPGIAHIVNDLKISIDKVIVQARNTHDEIQKFIVGKDITMESVVTLLSQELGKIFEDLKDEVGGPSLNGHRRDSGTARDRAQLVSQIMEKVGTVYIRVLTEVGVPRDVAETQFSGFSSLITRVVLVAGQIIDKHPFLLSIINLVVSIHLSGLSGLPLLMRLIPPLLGFDPLGPVKGSAAAWAQKTLWGSSVSPGIWSAILQQLMMTPSRGLYGKLFGTAGFITARL